MIRVAHQVGASLRQLSEASGLGRKTVTAIVQAGSRWRTRQEAGELLGADPEVVILPETAADTLPA